MPDLVPAVRAAVRTDLTVRRCVPASTYRLPCHAGFTLRDALAMVPSLHALGITPGSASPLLPARPGSTPGNAITHHQALKAEARNRHRGRRPGAGAGQCAHAYGRDRQPPRVVARWACKRPGLALSRLL